MMDTQPPGLPVIRFMMIGILLTFGPLLAYAWGAFETWQPIDPPPAADYSFAGVNQMGWRTGNLVVRGTDGSLYKYVPNSEPAWDGNVQPEMVVDAPCPERALIARLKQPFRQETNCLSTIIPEEWIGGPRVTYVRDGQGQLWMWVQDNGSTLVALALPAILLGLIIGYLLALLWHPLALALRPPALEERPARRQAVYAWEEHALRVGARVWSIFSMIVLLGIFLVGGGFSFTSRPANLFFRLSVLAGMAALAAAWRWQRLGGGLAVLFYIAGFAAVTQDKRGDWPALLLLLSLLYLPALLFLAAGVFKQRRKETS